MILFLLTLAAGVLICIAFGICIGLWFVSRDSKQPEKDDAEQTWSRTAAKETKPPPIGASRPADTIKVIGERFANAPMQRMADAREVLAKNIAAVVSKSESKRQAELRAKPDDITVARVKRTIAKSRKRSK